MKAKKVNYNKMRLGKEDRVSPTVSRPNLETTHKEVNISLKQVKQSIKKMSETRQKRG